MPVIFSSRNPQYTFTQSGAISLSALDILLTTFRAEYRGNLKFVAFSSIDQTYFTNFLAIKGVEVRAQGPLIFRTERSMIKSSTRYYWMDLPPSLPPSLPIFLPPIPLHYTALLGLRTCATPHSRPLTITAVPVEKKKTVEAICGK